MIVYMLAYTAPINEKSETGIVVSGQGLVVNTLCANIIARHEAIQIRTIMSYD